jgi:hypothetical protein
MTERIEAARRAVDAESADIEAERDAFAAFESRVADLPTVAAATVPSTSLATGRRPELEPFERVRTAYAETVMAVPHYEGTYGDTAAESIAAELGPDVATALRARRVLTADLKDAVLSASAASRREREAFLDVLERESASLVAAADALATLRADVDAVERSVPGTSGFNYLRHLRSRTTTIEERLERVAARRQETIDDHRRDLDSVPEDLPEYLYADLSSPYPVLATVAGLRGRLDAARRRVERAIASTH